MTIVHCDTPAQRQSAQQTSATDSTADSEAKARGEARGPGREKHRRKGAQANDTGEPLDSASADASVRPPCASPPCASGCCPARCAPALIACHPSRVSWRRTVSRMHRWERSRHGRRHEFDRRMLLLKFGQPWRTLRNEVAHTDSTAAGLGVADLEASELGHTAIHDGGEESREEESASCERALRRSVPGCVRSSNVWSGARLSCGERTCRGRGLDADRNGTEQRTAISAALQQSRAEQSTPTTHSARQTGRRTRERAEQRKEARRARTARRGKAERTAPWPTSPPRTTTRATRRVS